MPTPPCRLAVSPTQPQHRFEDVQDTYEIKRFNSVGVRSNSPVQGTDEERDAVIKFFEGEGEPVP